ncbi:hypothetical protein [Fischerella thermalis]|uniref:hypothetical protein n=1 Tax=Fischerella thermalis TaxID=372787 RepID=UPI0011AF8085|nr:hypothetical protein [Fischerella thermalis]
MNFHLELGAHSTALSPSEWGRLLSHIGLGDRVRLRCIVELMIGRIAGVIKPGSISSIRLAGIVEKPC